VKALTLHQPWASLVAAGVKMIETRSWSTRYRGPLAIHAGAKRPRAEWFDIGDAPFPVDDVLRQDTDTCSCYCDSWEWHETIGYQRDVHR
jgi:hypothetical protein